MRRQRFTVELELVADHQITMSDLAILLEVLLLDRPYIHDADATVWRAKCTTST